MILWNPWVKYINVYHLIKFDKNTFFVESIYKKIIINYCDHVYSLIFQWLLYTWQDWEFGYPISKDDFYIIHTLIYLFVLLFTPSIVTLFTKAISFNYKFSFFCLIRLKFYFGRLMYYVCEYLYDLCAFLLTRWKAFEILNVLRWTDT